MVRVLVIGTSGAGKTTFARALAARLGCSHVELDDLFWGEHWTPRPTAQFLASVQAAAAAERWVIDGNYSVARDTLWPRATHVVWLNFGRFTVLRRIFVRTVERAVLRRPLWQGNRESLRRAFFSRESILVWSATTFDKNRVQYAGLRASKQFPRLSWHELRSPREAVAFLRAQPPMERAER